MPEVLTPEPLLAEELAAWSERPGKGLAVSEHTGRVILLLEWRPGDEPQLVDMPLPAIGDVATSADVSLMRTSPVSGMAVSGTLSAGKLTDIFSDGCTSVVDVSHGFVVLRFLGAPARPLLDDLAPLDLSQAKFRPDSLRRTQIAGHGVMIHCTDANAFDLYVDRSYAWSLWRYISRCLDGARG